LHDVTVVYPYGTMKPGFSRHDDIRASTSSTLPARHRVSVPAPNAIETGNKTGNNKFCRLQYAFMQTCCFMHFRPLGHSACRKSSTSSLQWFSGHDRHGL